MLKNKKKVNDILHRQRQHPKKCRSLCCNTQNPFKCSIVRRWGIEDKMKTKKIVVDILLSLCDGVITMLRVIFWSLVLHRIELVYVHYLPLLLLC